MSKMINCHRCGNDFLPDEFYVGYVCKKCNREVGWEDEYYVVLTAREIDALETLIGHKLKGGQP